MIETFVAVAEVAPEAAKTGAAAAEGLASSVPSATEVPSTTEAEGTLSSTTESREILILPEGEGVDTIVNGGSQAALSEMASEVPPPEVGVQQALEREAMLARQSAFEKAMERANSDQARAEITAQYEKESNSEIKGGAYKELPSIEGKERHHMPCDYANEGFVNRESGPALVMDKEDHRETASCGRSREACEYRDDQKELLKNGQWEKAIQMDINDIHDKFGSKYDEGISKLSEYAKTIYSQTINGKN